MQAEITTQPKPFLSSLLLSFFVSFSSSIAVVRYLFWFERMSLKLSKLSSLPRNQIQPTRKNGFLTTTACRGSP